MSGRFAPDVGGLTEPLPITTVYVEGSEFVAAGNVVHVISWVHVPVVGPGGQMTIERQIVARVCMPKSVWARRVAEIRQGHDMLQGHKPETHTH